MSDPTHLNKSILIEQADTNDIDFIFDCTQRLQAHEDDGELKLHPDFSINLKKWLLIELSNQNSLFLIAYINKNPVGFIFAKSIINDNGFLKEPMKGVIHLLWVDEKTRKQNVAAKLLEKTEQCFISIGIKTVECFYTSNNLTARSFWNKKEYFPRSITARKILSKKNK